MVATQKAESPRYQLIGYILSTRKQARSDREQHFGIFSATASSSLDPCFTHINDLTNKVELG